MARARTATMRNPWILHRLMPYSWLGPVARGTPMGSSNDVWRVHIRESLKTGALRETRAHLGHTQRRICPRSHKYACQVPMGRAIPNPAPLGQARRRGDRNIEMACAISFLVSAVWGRLTEEAIATSRSKS